jgi:hypothetical protein
MAYTIKYLGHDVMCDSPEEIRALLNQNGTQPKSTEAPVRHGLFGEEPATGITGFVTRLQGKPRELLRHLANGGMMSRTQLLQLLGVADQHEFGGFLITISKHAAGAKIGTPIERTTARQTGNGPREHHYKIREDIKAEVKAALNA